MLRGRFAWRGGEWVLRYGIRPVRDLWMSESARFAAAGRWPRGNTRGVWPRVVGRRAGAGIVPGHVARATGGFCTVCAVGGYVGVSERRSLIRKLAVEDWNGGFVAPKGTGRGQYPDSGKIGDLSGGEKTRRADLCDFRSGSWPARVGWMLPLALTNMSQLNRVL